ncbi:MAG: hypothetical protein U0S13_07570 [Mycobacterium sp.]
MRALLAARASRVQPARDDKVVTAWNGLAITALAEASVALDDPVLLDAAVRCAEMIVDLHFVGERLRRAASAVWSGTALPSGGLCRAGHRLLTLYQLTADASWLATAAELVGLRRSTSPIRTGRAAGSTAPTTPSG